MQLKTDLIFEEGNWQSFPDNIKEDNTAKNRDGT